MKYCGEVSRAFSLLQSVAFTHYRTNGANMQLRVLAASLWALSLYSGAAHASINEPHHGLYAATSEALGRLIATLGATIDHNSVSGPRRTMPYSEMPIKAQPMTTTADTSPSAEMFEDDSSHSDGSGERKKLSVDSNDDTINTVLPVFAGRNTNEAGQSEKLRLPEACSAKATECTCRDGTIPRQTVLAIAAVFGTALWGWTNGTHSGFRCCSLLLFLMMFQQRAQTDTPI